VTGPALAGTIYPGRNAEANNFPSERRSGSAGKRLARQRFGLAAVRPQAVFPEDYQYIAALSASRRAELFRANQVIPRCLRQCDGAFESANGAPYDCALISTTN